MLSAAAWSCAKYTPWLQARVLCKLWCGPLCAHRMQTREGVLNRGCARFQPSNHVGFIPMSAQCYRAENASKWGVLCTQ